MRGTICIEEYKIVCIIGVHPHEREQEQEILVDLEMEVEMAEGDRLEETIDYEKAVEICQSVAKKGKFFLLESLTTALLAAVREKLKPLSLKVMVRKPAALARAKAVGVRLEI